MKKLLPSNVFNIKTICSSLSVLFFYATSIAQTHCIPTVSNQCSGQSNSTISNFALSTINNPSGCSPGSYASYFDAGQYPNIETTLTPGSSYPFSVSRATADFASPYSVRIWIDLNENGSFDDAGEMVASLNQAALCGLICNTPVTHNGTLTVPANAPAGVKRLRVRIFYNTNNGQPCGNFAYGEAEDYRIIIPGASNSITTSAINPLSYCSESSINIPFTVQGDYNTGNIFTAQLSDVTGSFATPINIGTLSSTTSGTIAGTIPAGSSSGNGYKVRVISTDPAITGSVNSENIIIENIPVVSITSSSASSVCENGTVNFVASSNTGDFIWQQSTNGVTYININGANSLNYTSFPITENTWFKAISTNGCGTGESVAVQISVTATSEIQITQTPQFSNLCNGTITLTVPNDVNDFVWSNQSTGNSLIVNEPGNYSGIGTDASGCDVITNVVTIIQTEPVPITTEPSGNISVCTLPLDLTAAEGFQNYIWSDESEGISIQINESGSYTVSAIDQNGCITTSSAVNVTVDNTTLDEIAVTPSQNVTFCIGLTVTLNAESGFQNYVWSDGTTGASIVIDESGDYSVSAQNENGCQAQSQIISVQEIGLPEVSFEYEQTNGYNIVFTNTTINGVTYLWDFGGSNTSTQLNPSFLFPFDGTYPIKLTATNPCGTSSVTIDVIVEKLNVENLSNLTQINIYPNPSHGLFTLSLESLFPENIDMTVLNSLGQKCHSNIIHVNGKSSHSFDFSNLSKGIYFIQLKTKEGNLTRRVSIN